MKKGIAILLMFALCLSLWGCQGDSNAPKDPVTFYYRRVEFDHGNEDSVIMGEVREAEGHKDDMMYLLNLYLAGPESPEMAVTFPYNTQLIRFTLSDKIASVTLSDSFAQLTGIDLTVACACIAKTVMELTGIQTVQLQTPTMMLGNDPFVVIDSASLLLIDGTEDAS